MEVADITIVTKKEHYKLIVLIIASNGPEYSKFQAIWYKYMNRFPEIKCFFLFGADQEILYKDNSIVTEFKESLIPGVLDKTLHGFEYINSNFTYDYLLRTNLSSFYRFDLLLRLLEKNRSNYVFAVIGYESRIPFPSGAGFILSPDVVELIVKHKAEVNRDIIDDVSIGRFLHTNKIPVIQAIRYDVTTPKSMDVIEAELGNRNFYHFRLKTLDRGYDVNVMNYLYNRYYVTSNESKPLLGEMNDVKNMVSKITPEILTSSIKDIFLQKCQQVSDIYEHLPILYDYSKKCETITEFGVRTPTSSYAFAAGLLDNGSSTKKLLGVDLNSNTEITKFKAECEAQKIEYKFIQGNDLYVNIERTDMLFIDSWHVYEQLIRELETHCYKVNKWIILHDTEVDKMTGESIRNGWNIYDQMKETGFSYAGIYLGLWPAVQQFLHNHKEFTLEKSLQNCNGLTILRRL